MQGPESARESLEEEIEYPEKYRSEDAETCQHGLHKKKLEWPDGKAGDCTRDRTARLFNCGIVPLIARCSTHMRSVFAKKDREI